MEDLGDISSVSPESAAAPTSRVVVPFKSDLPVVTTRPRSAVQAYYDSGLSEEVTVTQQVPKVAYDF